MKQFAFTIIAAICLMGCSQTSETSPISQNKIVPDSTFVIEDTTITLYPDSFTYQPKQGMVPDKETAARIAESVWLPVYGEEVIYSERPYHAHLVNDSIWVVWGNFELAEDPEDMRFGGSAFIAISRKDGRILQMLHEL